LFLKENHLQGVVGSNIKIGLYYNNELISILCLGKTRKCLNSISDNNDEYELLRFCNKTYMNILGSASKMFSYFIKKYKPYKVTSYSLLEWGDGDVYKNLNFDDYGYTVPGYYYVIDGVRKHRFMFQKAKLVKDGYDAEMTEYDIMLSRGYDRVWTTGNKKWIWENK